MNHKSDRCLECARCILFNFRATDLDCPFCRSRLIYDYKMHYVNCTNCDYAVKLKLPEEMYHMLTDDELRQYA